MKRLSRLMLTAFTIAALWFNPLTVAFALPEGGGNGQTLLSLQSYNFPDRFIRHRDYKGFLDPIAGELDQKDATFRAVPGLAGGGNISLEASNLPNFFLVAEGEAVALRQRPPNDAQFDRSATFIVQPGLADRSAKSLESLAQRGSYLRHSGFVLFVHPTDNSDLFKADATFREVVRNGSTRVVDKPVKAGPFVPTTHGDVHIRTMDGLTFDFQATGDYLLFQSTNGEAVIQSRQVAWEKNPKVSVNRAAAMRVMSDIIELQLEPTLTFTINGQPTPLPTARMALPGGGAIEPSGGATLLVYWPSDSLVARLKWYSNQTMDVEVRRDLPPQRTYEGLIGNLDGKRDNDFQIRGGEYLPPKPSNESIARVGESWRVRAGESLFGRAPPVAATGVVQTQPGIADLDAAARLAAHDACKSGGVTDAMALRHCVYDVAATGDPTFVQSAKQYQQTVAALPAAERTGEKPEPIAVLAPAAQPVGNSPGLFLPGEKLQRGSRYAMSGHYLTFQADGNLCLYKAAGDQWVWCINNDPSVQHQRSAAVEMTRDGRLLVSDADGGIVWQAPAGNAQSGAGIFITDAGALELRVPGGAVVWSSRGN